MSARQNCLFAWRVLVSVPLGLAFCLLCAMNAECGLALAHRFLEPIMKNHEKDPKSRALMLPEGVWPILRQFRDIARTEEAFYLHFERLPEQAIMVLRSRWLAPLGLASTRWALFRRICKFWGAGCRDTAGDRRTRAAHEADDRQGRFVFVQDAA